MIWLAIYLYLCGILVSCAAFIEEGNVNYRNAVVLLFLWPVSMPIIFLYALARGS